MKTKEFSFVTRIKKHAVSTWRILIPIKIIKNIDMRKKVKVTISQGDDLK